MSDVTIAVSDDVRAEIARAFAELRPHMIENAAADKDLDPASRFDDFRAEDLEQFLNAYEAMFMEALEGRGRVPRDLYLETPLPPEIEEQGQTAADMVRGNVVSAVMLAHRLLPLVREDLRDDAARWLASFLSGYSHEVVGRALAIEAGKR
jgi:hypothetical protein